MDTVLGIFPLFESCRGFLSVHGFDGNEVLQFSHRYGALNVLRSMLSWYVCQDRVVQGR